MLLEVQQWPEISTLRLAVLDTNAEAAAFWQAMGFRATGETKPYRYAAVETTARLYERPVRLP